MLFKRRYLKYFVLTILHGRVDEHCTCIPNFRSPEMTDREIANGFNYLKNGKKNFAPCFGLKVIGTDQSRRGC